MWGAEHTSRAKQGYAQFHSATLHWKIAPDIVGWMRLVHAEPVDAVVEGHTLTIQGSGMLTFQICAPGLSEDDLRPAAWALPNLPIRISALPVSFQVIRQPEWLEVSYDAGPGKEIEMQLQI